MSSAIFPPNCPGLNVLIMMALAVDYMMYITVLTLNMLNCFKGYKRYIHISYHIFDFVQQKTTVEQPYIHSGATLHSQWSNPTFTVEQPYIQWSNPTFTVEQPYIHSGATLHSQWSNPTFTVEQPYIHSGATLH